MVLDNLPFLLSDTVGFIRKLPHQLVESFKSTLDEVREADLLLHVVDISHPNFEEQIAVVKETLQEIGAGEKPVFLIFNKIDAYSFIQKDEDDLTPATKENMTLDELKNSWIAKANTPCIFISARERINIDKLRKDLYGMVLRDTCGTLPVQQLFILIPCGNAGKENENTILGTMAEQMVTVLDRENTILNRFIAQMRDVTVQGDSMRFRRNLERAGEIMAYEISKTLEYQPRSVETPLGEAEIMMPDEEIVVATILRRDCRFTRDS